MNESTNKSGFTKIEHFTFDVILPMLTPSAQSVFLRIYRQTVGWGKQTDTISNSQFSKYCHIKDNQTIKKAVMELQDLELITVHGAVTAIKEYGVNWETLTRRQQEYMERMGIVY